MMPPRKRIRPERVRATKLDEHTLTPHDREKSLLAHSPATAKAHLERVGSMPLILPKEVKMIWQGVMSAKDILNLRIDTRYQREEITAEVNMLIHVLNNGGQIPDPVTIAERRDKTRWVVDGQQRFWAHVDTGKPMQARIFSVSTFEEELTLFHVLNNSRKLTARIKLKSWPGASGKAIEWIATSEESPLRGLVDMSTNKGEFPVVTVMRGLVAAVAGIVPTGSVDVIATAFDRAYNRDPKWADKAMRFYASIVASIFEKEIPLRHLAALAIGRVAHATWRPLSVDDAWSTPTPKESSRLKRVDWDRVAPGFAARWLPIVVSEVRKHWPDSADPEEYARQRGKKAEDSVHA